MKTIKRLTVLVLGITLMLTSHTAFAAATYEKEIYQYLKSKMGFNTAAACGVLANIKAESGFKTSSVGDHGTSYGICQWHNGRYTKLISYCESQNLDYKEIDGQLAYLHYELKKSYPKVYNYLKSVSNNEQGAYDAGYYWCYYYEIPKTRAASSVRRGETAKNTYYPKYAKSSNVEQETVTTATKTDTTKTKTSVKAAASTSYKTGTYKLKTNVPVRSGANKTSKQIGSLKKGTLLSVSTIKNDKWAKLSYNNKTAYASLLYTTYVSSSTKKGSNTFGDAKEMQVKTLKVNLSGTTDVVLSWDKVSGAKKYTLQYKAATASKWQTLKTTSVTSYKKKGLKAGKAYSFRIKVYGEKTYTESEKVYIMKKMAKPVVKKASQKAMTIKWKKTSGVTGYQVSVSTTAEKKVVKTTSKTSVTYSVKKGKKYKVSVRAYKKISGEKVYGPWSDVTQYQK